MSSEDLVELFRVESQDLLDELERGLVELEEAPTEREVIDRVFRAVHTLKGGAGVVGMTEVVDFAHLAESVLERVRSGKLSVDSGLVTELLGALDVLRRMVALAIRGEPAASAVDPELRIALQKRLPSATPITPSRAPAARALGPRLLKITLAFRRDLFVTGQDPLMLIDELSALGELVEVRLDASSLPALAEVDPHALEVAWTVYLRTEEPRHAIDQVFIFVRDENPIRIEDITSEPERHLDLSAAEQRLGELLVAEGHVTPDDLTTALSAQKRIGELLVEGGKLAPGALERTLGKQRTLRNLKRGGMSVRVDATKLDRLLNAVGELVIAAAQVGKTSDDARSTPETRRGSLETLDRIIRGIQQHVMQVRMVSVEDSFSRMRRVVRDTAAQLGKQVELELHGTETELDKTVVEKLSEMLTHMVRNCVDHGLESPAERLALGKPETGQIRLSAEQRAGTIVIGVADDGRGLDRERILRRARERNLVRDERGLSDAAVYDLLFQPGFSTAEQVTEISGRGVGLDVVRRAAEELNGSVEVHATPGRGTEFWIRLPLTLAIIEGMTVRVGRQHWVFPLVGVSELVIPRSDRLRPIEGGNHMLRVRDEYLPFVDLGRVFRVEGSRPPLSSTVAVVVSAGKRKFAVAVDDVLGLDQVVVKSLESSLLLVEFLGGAGCRPPGVGGATILGDGSIAIILDAHGLERAAFDTGSPQATERSAAEDLPC
jgi:two-component system chemotaxis sensor kinase CheA